MNDIQYKLDKAFCAICDIVLDKQDAIKLSLACLLADGHLLIEDLPGMGKTTLAHALAKALGFDFNRIQFTNDLLPADILGMMIYDTPSGAFKFHRGAIFSELLLADEINRSSPKSQSALLEAMEERQVTIDGTSYALPRPFFVIATQNPAQQFGVYPLPESQLDRFLMCVSMGYPSQRAERELLEGKDRRTLVADLQPFLSKDEAIMAQNQVRNLYVAPVVLDYIQTLSKKAQEGSQHHGLSPRAVLGLKRAAQAFAYLSGQDNVAIDDVQAVFKAVANHRLGQPFLAAGSAQASFAEQILASVAID